MSGLIRDDQAHGQVDGPDGGSRRQVERGVLTAYWLVSGYGLLAWRALAWLAGITMAFALAFHLVRLHPPTAASLVLDESAVCIPFHHLAH